EFAQFESVVCLEGPIRDSSRPAPEVRPGCSCPTYPTPRGSLDVRFRSQIIYGRDQQVRLLAAHEIEIPHGPAHIAGQGRGPDEAGCPIAYRSTTVTFLMSSVAGRLFRSLARSNRSRTG